MGGDAGVTLACWFIFCCTVCVNTMSVSLSVLLLLPAVVFLLFRIGAIRVGYERGSPRSGVLPFGCIFCWFKYSILPWLQYRVMPG